MIPKKNFLIELKETKQKEILSFYSILENYTEKSVTKAIVIFNRKLLIIIYTIPKQELGKHSCHIEIQY